jgi:hypothetical protein
LPPKALAATRRAAAGPLWSFTHSQPLFPLPSLSHNGSFDLRGSRIRAAGGRIHVGQQDLHGEQMDLRPAMPDSVAGRRLWLLLPH